MCAEAHYNEWENTWVNKLALGLRIVELRKKMKLSQDSLSAKSGVARGAIQQLEKGDANPTIETLEAIAKALGCSFLDLCPKEPSNTKPSYVALQELIDAPGARLPWETLSQVLQSFANADRALRAHVLALLYEDVSIADEFLSDKKPDSSRARKIRA